MEGFAGFSSNPAQPAQYSSPMDSVRPGEPIDVKDVAPGKTHISLLQEVCTRKQITPQYEILASEGQVHEPTFIFRVTVQDMVVKAQGKSKKVAKHTAAKRILEQLVLNGKHIEWGVPGRTQEEATNYLNSLMPEINQTVSATEGDAQVGAAGGDDDSPPKQPLDNPIGRLNERCLKRKFPPPEFIIEDETGQPHEKQFVVNCRVGMWEEKGSGRNKRTAKRIAAQKMLQHLLDMPDLDNFDGDDETLIQKFSMSFRGLGRVMTPLDQQRLDAFFSPLIHCPGDNLRSLRGRKSPLKDLNARPFNFKKLLDKIGHDHGFAVRYVDLEVRPDGQYQCLVQLSMKPVAVCCGSGVTQEEARCAAAYDALHYLKMMTNQNEE